MGENGDVTSFRAVDYKSRPSSQSIFQGKQLAVTTSMSEERPTTIRQTPTEPRTGSSPGSKEGLSEGKPMLKQVPQPGSSEEKYEEGGMGLLHGNMPNMGVSSAASASGLTFDLPEVSTSLGATANIWPNPQADEAAMLHSFQTMNNNALSLPSYGVNNNNSLLGGSGVGMPPGAIGSHVPPGPGSHMSAVGGVNPVMSMNMNGYVSQHHRRAITGSQNGYPFGMHKSANGRLPWNAQSIQWTGGQNVSPWIAALQQQKQNRPMPPNLAMNGPSYRHKSQMQHHQPPVGNSYVPHSRYRGRHSGVAGAPMFSGGGGYDQFQGRDAQENLGNFQEPRQTAQDSMRMDSLQTQIMDIMRQSQFEGSDQAKGARGTYGVEEHSLLDEGNIDTGGFSLRMDRPERYSRKVFVGGLPPDIDEEEITAAFRRFGHLVVDWPHKAESKSYFPPKGYCFLLFHEEISVQTLIDACYAEEGKLYWFVSSPTMKEKPVQIRSWNLGDSDFVMDGSQPIDPRKTIFVGGVPRPLRAVELAMIMERLYGGVCYAGIDTDPELKYPKGAGRVAFSNQQSYIAAISARFVQLQQGDIDKRVEVKPYVLDDQLCDECQGGRCGGKFAPFFCANITCLQYYCEHCWSQIHARPGREFHKPLVKEGADRPRAVPFRWC